MPQTWLYTDPVSFNTVSADKAPHPGFPVDHTIGKGGENG